MTSLSEALGLPGSGWRPYGPSAGTRVQGEQRTSHVMRRRQVGNPEDLPHRAHLARMADACSGRVDAVNRALGRRARRGRPLPRASARTAGHTKPNRDRVGFALRAVL